ncbi:NADH-quinone oxidoreductase subunit D [Taibaiella sp. KBW10]|uniref:NADH-quinone oxidoreductase subunit D n=1 Tax=Taibaiella sp. KBW10 TaxID=2153357 RepID=UPI000F5A1BB6|nr:NADH-quinone oxidoreductase subunit D [Taibaiella sp. KBW10]RQO31693.1 NADH-quinone oxidoreductase subunit D [Taibaiella sp. KBW10]
MVEKHIQLAENSVEKETTTINLGPTHPATHGIFQNVMEIDGERVIKTEMTVGYIHRAFEKIAERRPYNQVTPLTDRLNYCSAPINNFGWHMTIEKLVGLEVPKRVDYLRVVIMELARIADHLVCNSVIGVDTGALTPFTYVFQWREKIYEIYECICGSRLTTNIGRIGGFERNFTDDAWKKIHDFMDGFPAILKEFEALLTRNRIFMDRCIGAGPISAERALNWSMTGPNLRASGVDYDVRVHSPYSSYNEFDFKIPVGSAGDVYDRYLVRNGEMWESYRIIQQALEKLKGMDSSIFHADAPEFYLPEKAAVYTKMEALIYHFKIVMGEVDLPVGEVYHAVEGGNGEVGYYLVSDGGRTPYRLHFRRPSFIYYQAFNEMVAGGLFSDAVVTLSSINVIAGELDA